MKQAHQRVSALVSLVLVAAIGNVMAAGADSQSTTIRFVNPDSVAETLKFEGELAIGDTRGLYTDAGTPVTVRRTESGLSIDSRGKVVDVPYPDSEGLLVTRDEEVRIDGDGQERRVIVLRGDADASAEGHALHQQHVIVLKDGEGADLNWIEAIADATDGEKELIIDDADGTHKVVVIRKNVLKEGEAGVGE